MRKLLVASIVASFAVMLAAGPASADHLNSPNHNYYKSDRIAQEDYCK
jgi:hypothetical protein